MTSYEVKHELQEKLIFSGNPENFYSELFKSRYDMVSHSAMFHISSDVENPVEILFLKQIENRILGKMNEAIKIKLSVK